MSPKKDTMHQDCLETVSVELSKPGNASHEQFASPFGSPSSPESRAAERRLVRKLDMTLLPIVWILYMFNYLDRNNIA
jgi:hypothetical protein